ncbi:MAG: MmgE/PrpD family protein [Sphingomonadaceae bacterium]
MSGQIGTASEALARAALRPVDARSRARARLHLLDWLACIAGAGRSDVAEMARAAEPDMLTRAALRGNLLEMDDVDRQARLHPGPVLWPAVLAAARETDATFAMLLDGFVAGVEAMVQLGRTLDAHHYGFWHPTATAGQAGAAVAAARIFGLDQGQTADALGHSVSLAGGLWQVRHEPGAHTKAIHAAQAGLAGLWHARLARAGFRGPRAILEGPQGLWVATTRAPHPLEAADGWRVHELSFKPWAACRHAHPTIDAALALPDDALAKGPILVETYGDALAFCDRAEPRTPAEAKFSLQHCVAIVAVRGRPQLADFEPDAIADPAIVAARARVRVARAPEFDAAYPAHYGARLAVGGAVAEVADAWGDPERPLDEEGLAGKLRALAAWGGLPEGEAEAALALVRDHPDSAPAAPVVALVARWMAA